MYFFLNTNLPKPGESEPLFALIFNMAIKLMDPDSINIHCNLLKIGGIFFWFIFLFCELALGLISVQNLLRIYIISEINKLYEKIISRRDKINESLIILLRDCLFLKHL